LVDNGSNPDDISAAIPANGDPKTFARVSIPLPPRDPDSRQMRGAQSKSLSEY
jgi:hypothetical protein